MGLLLSLFFIVFGIISFIVDKDTTSYQMLFLIASLFYIGGSIQYWVDNRTKIVNKSIEIFNKFLDMYNENIAKKNPPSGSTAQQDN